MQEHSYLISWKYALILWDSGLVFGFMEEVISK